MVEKAFCKVWKRISLGEGHQYREKIKLPHLDTEVLENMVFRKRSAEIQLACGCVVALANTHSFTGHELPYPSGDSSHSPFGP